VESASTAEVADYADVIVITYLREHLLTKHI